MPFFLRKKPEPVGAENPAASQPLTDGKITLHDFFAKSAAEFTATQVRLASYDAENDPLSPRHSVHVRGSLGLHLRMTAAMTALAGRMVSEGRGNKKIDSQSATEKILGDDATLFRIYSRNLEKDMQEANRHIRAHLPHLIS